MLKSSLATSTAALCAALVMFAVSQPASAQVVVEAPAAPVVVAPAPVVVAAPPAVVVAPRPVVCTWVRRREPDGGYYGWHWHHFRVCE